jgi:hypothetical protein
MWIGWVYQFCQQSDGRSNDEKQVNNMQDATVLYQNKNKTNSMV